MMSDHSLLRCVTVLAPVVVCVFLRLPSAELVPSLPSTRIMTPSVKLDRCHNCDQRYFRHYEAKKCIPVYDEGCKCPKGFNCPDFPTVEDETVCTYKGKTYSKRERIPTSNICERCSCRKNGPDPAYIDCVSSECPSLFNGPPDRGCYYVYEQGHCCETATKCINDSTSGGAGEVEPTCEFEGKTYRFGQKMYSEEDHCLICLCDKDFHGKNSSSCRILDCQPERMLPRLKGGCIPIYHEQTCCSIGSHCPDSYNKAELGDPNPYIALNKSGTDPLTYCAFDGKRFDIGDELKISKSCTICTCITPPDITCVMESCE